MDDSNLQNVYNSIAYHFDKTRYKKWNSINKFLNDIPKNQYICEVGCGNGKNMINTDHIFLGFDFSIEFCKICRNKNLEVGICNNMNIPLKDNCFDHVISIAVIHHLSCPKNRKKCVEELIRVCNIGGNIFIQVWSFERETGKKYLEQDNYIDWHDQKTGNIFKRFYHFFRKGELEELLPNNVKIIESKYELNNYIVIVKKIM